MYDGQVYTFALEDLGTLEEQKLFQFFNEGHEKDIFVTYDSENQYAGAITYHSLLSNPDVSSAVISEKLILDKDFWDKAFAALVGEENKVLPVFSPDMEMLYLAKYEPQFRRVWEKMCFLGSLETEISGFWISTQHNKKHFHITGCNMVLYYFRNWLISQGKDVTVSGEQWKQFGIQEGRANDSEVILVDEKCSEIEYLYDEYLYGLRGERAEIKNIFAKEFVGDMEAEDKIMFWMSSVSGIFASFNIISLIQMYLKKSGKTCVVVMPTMEDLIRRGTHWLKTAIKFMKEVQDAGANLSMWNELDKICIGKYSVCYTAQAVDIVKIPIVIRERTNAVGIVQSLAFLTHFYRKRDASKFENEFSDEARNITDFYVASDFFADWICQQDGRWSDKMLRFGYPKQDILYHYIYGERDIPEDWLKKTEGKKVFLFTMLKQSWLDNFFQEDNQVIILRPHPDYLNTYGEFFRELEVAAQGKIILDDRVSYNASFCLADAMITEPLCSVGVNYLSTGKPILLRSDVVDETNICVDFSQEDWYKASYIGTSDQDIFEFMEMIRQGKDIKKKELEKYRSHMIKDFDGKVCERIYDYFETNKN